MREASKLRRIKQENRGREITGAKEEALRLEQRMCQPEVYSDALKHKLKELYQKCAEIID